MDLVFAHLPYLVFDELFRPLVAENAPIAVGVFNGFSDAPIQRHMRRNYPVNLTRKHFVARIERPLEAVFFQPQDGVDEFAVVDELRIDAAHLLYSGVRDFGQEAPFDAETPPVANGAPDDAAQDVAAPFVGGDDAVRD